MIQFQSAGKLAYQVTENGEVTASGSLDICDDVIFIRIAKAQEDILDFFFRAMLNVCAGYEDHIVKSDLPPSYLSQFGFAGDTVKTAEIKFPKNCKPD